MAPTKPEPCPFCGSPVIRSYEPFYETTTYHCSNNWCAAEVAFHGAGVKTREDSDRLWNSRTTDSKPI